MTSPSASQALRLYVAEKYASLQAEDPPSTFGHIIPHVLHHSPEQASARLSNLASCLREQLQGISTEPDLRVYINPVFEKAGYNQLLQPQGLPPVQVKMSSSGEIDLQNVQTIGAVPFKQTSMQREYYDVHDRQSTYYKAKGDKEARGALIQDDLDEVAGDMVEMLQIQDPDGMRRDLAQLQGPGELDSVEVYSLTSASRPATPSAASAEGGIRYCDAGIAVSVGDGENPSSLAVNGLIEYESLPKRATVRRAADTGTWSGEDYAHAVLRKRSERVHEQLVHGLCQSLAYLLCANEQAGAWLGMVYIGTRFSRLAFIDGLVLIELKPTRKPFLFGSSWESGLMVPEDSSPTSVTPIPVSTGQGASQPTPFTSILAPQSSVEDQLAHDLVKEWQGPKVALDSDEIQAFFDFGLAAALDFASANVISPLNRLPVPPPSSPLRSFMRHSLGIDPERSRLRILAFGHSNSKIKVYINALLRGSAIVRARMQAEDADQDRPPTRPPGNDGSDGGAAGQGGPGNPSIRCATRPSAGQGAASERAGGDSADDVGPHDSASQVGNDDDLDAVFEDLDGLDVIPVTTDVFDAAVLARLKSGSPASIPQTPPRAPIDAFGDLPSSATAPSTSGPSTPADSPSRVLASSPSPTPIHDQPLGAAADKPRTLMAGIGATGFFKARTAARRELRPPPSP